MLHSKTKSFFFALSLLGATATGMCLVSCSNTPAKTLPAAASNWAKKYQQQEDKDMKDLEKLGSLARKKPSLAEAIFSRTELISAF